MQVHFTTALSDEEKLFLRQNRISEEEVFIHPHITATARSEIMKALKMTVAWGAPCEKGGHRLRSRRNHCVICSPACLSHEKRFSEPGMVYVAGSKSLNLIKIGISGDLENRIYQLNNQRLGGVSDWKIEFKTHCDQAGRVENNVHKHLSHHRHQTGFATRGEISRETFSYPVADAVALLQRLAAENSSDAPAKQVKEWSATKIEKVRKEIAEFKELLRIAHSPSRFSAAGVRSAGLQKPALRPYSNSNSTPMPEQISFVDIDFIENAEPRCPCVLVVDTSSSMNGAPIEALNAGLEQFAQELNSDNLARKRVEVAIVSFGREVQTIQDFTSVESFVPPRFQADGTTPMGQAVVEAIAMVEERRKRYKSAGIIYYRPWIFLITDGAPTDQSTHFWRKAIDLVHEGENSKKMLFFGIAVMDADLKTLNELCPKNRPAMKLEGLSFRELFKWLSTTLKTVSSAKPGASGLSLPPTSGWASVDI